MELPMTESIDINKNVIGYLDYFLINKEISIVKLKSLFISNLNDKTNYRIEKRSLIETIKEFIKKKKIDYLNFQEKTEINSNYEINDNYEPEIKNNVRLEMLHVNDPIDFLEHYIELLESE